MSKQSSKSKASKSTTAPVASSSSSAHPESTTVATAATATAEHISVQDLLDETQLTNQTIPICTVCQSMLDFSQGDGNQVVCGTCNNHENIEVFLNYKFISKKIIDAKKNKQVIDKIKEMEEDQKALIDEKCPSCGNPQMMFYSMQLRSADEGETVFYECPKCSYKSRLNN